jgi:hypothetical protein
MREKRKVERFDLQIETMLIVQNETIMDKQPMLLSRDISCAGVFLDTNNPLPIGTRVDLNLLLSQHEFGSKKKDERINIITSGKVVRTNDHGMAVEFDELYKIKPFTPAS